MSIDVHADWSLSAEARKSQASSAISSWVKHVAIAADARIDNHAALCAELGLARGALTPELLGEAYLAWGDGCADRLSGDFAFVLWDTRRERLVAARDPFGVKPLYLRVAEDQVWFSSQVEPLLAGASSKPIVDDHRVVEYLLGRYTSHDATFFRDVRQVPPGHFVVATPSGLTRHPYWAAPVQDAAIGRLSYRETHAELRRLFLQSVQRRLQSDRPVMIHVSGGLDSSSIACAADSLSRSASVSPPLRAVSGIYLGLACDESVFIDAVERSLSFPLERWDGIASTSLDLTAPHVSEPGIRATFMDGTMGDIDIARSHGAAVILSGIGGDQFGSVDGYVRDQIAHSEWLGALSSLLFFSGATTAARLGRIRYTLKESIPLPFLEAVARKRVRFPEWLSSESRTVVVDVVSARRREIGSKYHVQRGAWRRLTSAQLARTVSMRSAQALQSGMEYRFPFLDRDLVRFAASVPHWNWPRPGQFSRLHREALRDLLPREIATRSGKAEFSSALENRVRRAQPLIRQLFGDRWTTSRYVNQARAGKFWRTVMAASGAPVSRSKDLRHVWAIATLEAWHRKVLG